MKQTVKLLICLLLMMLLTGCCKHDWEEATCEHPRTCVECGWEVGEKGEHNWEEATCTDPETCRNCGETRGKANGHRWAGLTCQECGETGEKSAEKVPDVEMPAENDGSQGITPEEYMAYLMEYTKRFVGEYELGESVTNNDEEYICYVNIGRERAYRLIMILDESTGYIRDVYIMQLKEDKFNGDQLIMYAIAIAMGEPDPDNLAELYSRLEGAMTSQKIEDTSVYEVYELDGYYIQIYRHENRRGETTIVDVIRK